MRNWAVKGPWRENNLHFNKAAEQISHFLQTTTVLWNLQWLLKRLFLMTALRSCSKALDPEDAGDAVSANYTHICITVSLDCFVLISITD